jgi:hypothetical protein
MASGVSSAAYGFGATATNVNAIALGTGASASGPSSTAIGPLATASALDAFAGGASAVASGANSTAIGVSARATQVNATAYGANAVANGQNSTAIGPNASVGPMGTNSSAIGANASATIPNNMVLGTVSQTYTTPGIDSDLSRYRQSGLLGIVTSDVNGNLASDGGALYQETAMIKAGVAVAMALSDPVLQGDQRFGLKLNGGGFDGAGAVGVSAAGIVARRLFSDSDSLTLSGAGGVSSANVFGYSKTAFGGRVSLQLAW